MKLNIKEFIQENKIYTIFFFVLMVITLLISTTTYEYTDFSLQLPFRTLYGSIVYGIVISMGMMFYIIFTKNNYKKIKIEKLYLIVAIPIGILYCITNPLGKVPDEDYQARKAMAISQGNIFSIADENGNAIEKENVKIPQLVSRKINSYKEAIERINIEETNEKIELTYNTMALYSPICHLPQAVGITIARIFGGSIVVQFYLGRIVNMLVAVMLMYFAIKLIPLKKIIIVFLGLLPITMNEFASLSADAITISMCILYIAYILYLKYQKLDKYSKKQLIVLGILTILVALVKIVYVPLVLLLFLLPKERFKNLKNKNIIIISFIAGALILNFMWLIYCSRFLVEFNPGVDSKEQVKYVLTHPITYILIIFRTTIVYLQNYIVCLNGEGLSHYNAQASVVYVFTSIILFAFLFFVKDKEEYDEIYIDVKTKIILCIIFTLITGLIYSSLYVQWNIVSNQIIEGVQGRYFLPVLILTALIFDNNYISVNKKISKRYIFIFMLFFNLNALANICFTYISGHPIEYLIK